jgi:23S rRNA (uracil1939-C5)-methyltransferase
LYCGTGTIGISLSGYCRQVIGIETIAVAIEDACLNAQLNQVDNCYFINADLNHPGRLVAELSRFDPPRVVITDPPRAGLHPDTIQWLTSMRPARLIYVSCNPATLARDLAILCGHHGYHLQSLHPLDLFPQTAHIECIAMLEVG